MKLFKSLRQPTLIDLNILSFQTPLGEMHFDFLFNGNKISELKPQMTATRDKIHISSWNMDECYVEFLRGEFVPKIASSMEVNSCVAGIWRIKNLSKNLKITLKCYLETSFDSKIEEYPESGEGLVSQTFENDFYKLSIGTGDDDYLTQRSLVGQSMPHRFQNLIIPDMIKCVSGGLQVDLPVLESEEIVQIQFITAWSFKTNPELSTFFAVDQASDYVLDCLGVIE